MENVIQNIVTYGFLIIVGGCLVSIPLIAIHSIYRYFVPAPYNPYACYYAPPLSERDHMTNEIKKAVNEAMGEREGF